MRTILLLVVLVACGCREKRPVNRVGVAHMEVREHKTNNEVYMIFHGTNHGKDDFDIESWARTNPPTTGSNNVRIGWNLEEWKHLTNGTNNVFLESPTARKSASPSRRLTE